ncbi:hypothetical protein PRIPAC_92075 [Pristionchus pacificus]|uniref:Uncharacterized protein n=1 Tax=Pristionchus pacificus TaxID=54126 RepID=A0A2A6BIR0_PRIPA|nr:hypothetical protein PRIPAC_92075 [Pristionchus pacificus]|eukprot:PDM65681.1 hypothetical protein PRIPAC_45595 [Pristionchus pacificus]
MSTISVEDFVELKRNMEERMNGFEEAIVELKASNAHLQELVYQMLDMLPVNSQGVHDAPHDANRAQGVQSGRMVATRNDSSNDHEEAYRSDRRRDRSHGLEVLRNEPDSNLSPTLSSFTEYESSAQFSSLHSTHSLASLTGERAWEMMRRLPAFRTLVANRPRMPHSRLSLPVSHPNMNSRPEMLNERSGQQEANRNFFNISSLPSEIRWKLFAFLTTSIGKVRLVCKSWHAMVSEDCMNVGIEFLKREAACFGMLRAIAEQLEIFPETPQRTTVGNRDDFVRLSFDISYGSPGLEFLRSCIGTKSRVVDIARPESGPQRNGELSAVAFYDAVSKFLKPLKQVTEMNLWQHYINNDNSKLLKKLTAHRYVRKMYFTVDVQTNPQAFLFNISERVEYFNIRLVNSQARSDHVTTSVRDKSASWVEMVLAMFHCRACSIYLNTYVVDLFSSEDFGSIVEMLENRGLPFHLKANLHQEPSRILAKAVKALKKDISKCGNVWIVSIWSKPPPAHAEL